MKVLEPEWASANFNFEVNGRRQTSDQAAMAVRVLPKFDRMDAEAWPGTLKEVASEELIHRKVWKLRSWKLEVEKLEVEVQVPVPPAAALPASPLSLPLPCPL